MITKQNFKQLLEKLNFQNLDEKIYIKKFENFELKVDFEKEELIYPKELKVNDKTTSNFSHNENFVVFECVNRLLEKGYKPRHIELEPKWSLGHSQKSGKADIAIKDNKNKTLCIIECKTAGKEFENAIKLTELDGGQIFSYSANSGADYIALYASNEKAEFQYRLISLKDNENLLENNPNLKSYKKARSGVYGDTAKALFEVWSETYKQNYIKGLFEKEVGIYNNLEKNKFSVNDLKSVSESDISKIYHKFATILRQHNVGSRENAFDKLINLFLCKIVDELKNSEELQFYWRGVAYDDEFSFVDRLQKLYKEGMKKFLNEDITYIENDEIDKYFALFDIKTIKQKVKEAVKQLKFYTSNDFAFIEVHNKKLFYQNFEILLKIVLLFQDIYLTNSDENQFLGDLFEGFLDQGIKQNEGQYFTPMPIVKFIVHSLPEKSYERAIDYACGAGHFLNEFAKHHKEAEVVGIEKEYRLSKVAKVSSFMYGNQNIEIVYDDALKKDVVKEKFDVLLSNPPYSVKGFLETLSKEDLEQFELTKIVDKKSYVSNNSIECFFIEKAKILLDSGGIGAIIVPISILDKTNSKIFIKTREIILRYFDLKAIVKLPTGTFGKTGTTTIIFYLEKRDEKVDFANKSQEVVDRLFNNDFSLLHRFDYRNYFYKYLEFMGYDEKGYYDFIKGKYNKKLFENEMFKSYKEKFIKSLKAKDKKLGYKKLRKRFLDEVKEIEKERLYYFVASKVNGEVLVILPPEKNSEIKKFLGYEWSSAKGNEGIKYISKQKVKNNEEAVIEKISTLNNIETPLYNPSNFDDETKINKIIKNWLEKKEFEIKDEKADEFVKLFSLTSMLDLKEVEFKKVINLQGKTEIEIKSRWNFVKLGEVVDTIGGLWEGKKPPFIKINVIRNTNFSENNGNNINFSNIKVLNVEKNQFKTRQLKESDILLEKSGGSATQAVGRVMYFNLKDTNYSFSNFMVRLRVNKQNILSKYIFIILDYIYNKGYTFQMQLGMSNIKNLQMAQYLNIKIPLPPLDIQKKIVEECEEVDNLSEKLKIENEKLRGEIENEVKKIDNKFELVKLKECAELVRGVTYQKYQQVEFSKNKILTADNIDLEGNLVINKIIYIDDNVKISKEKKLKKDDIFICLSSGSLKHLGKVAFIKEDTDYFAGGFMGIIRSKSVISKYIFAILHSKKYKKSLENLAVGSNINNLSSMINELKIPLPSLEVQKQIVVKIETLEAKIENNQKIIDNSKIEKEKILEKYL